MFEKLFLKLMSGSGLGAATARMALSIHLVMQGRAVNDEDSYQSNTSWAFYVILEAGLTMIAANLPSLWCLTRDISPESVLRSVRSLISVRSSHGSEKSPEIFDVADGRS
jgi:hypothetical protein